MGSPMAGLTSSIADLGVQMIAPGPSLSTLLSLEFAPFPGRPSPCGNKDGLEQFQNYIILIAKKARERSLPFSPTLHPLHCITMIRLPQHGP